MEAGGLVSRPGLRMRRGCPVWGLQGHHGAPQNTAGPHGTPGVSSPGLSFTPAVLGLTSRA